MTARSRLLAFGTAGLLVIAGILCAVLSSGLGAQIAAILLLSFGFGGAVLLVFLEVGLSEDRARAREEAERRRRERRAAAQQAGDRQRPRGPRWPRRPG